MNRDFINTLLLAVAFLSLFGIAELLYHRFKIKVEITRKLVHAGTGLLTLLFPILLGNHWLVLLLCSSFALLLIWSQQYNFLKSINAIDRISVGSIAYPASAYICYLAFDFFSGQLIFYYLPILILAFSDPIAALAGKKWPYGKFKTGNETKTLTGSCMFLLSAFIISVALFELLHAELTKTYINNSFLIALLSALTEALSRKGFDNLTIPLTVLIALIILL